MSTLVDDHLLLRRYAEDGAEDAFAELVRRHLDHVYSVAAREVQDPHLAADLTQAAFILLARKADKIRAQESLSGWLFQTVRYAARNARRAAWRRERHEQEAASMMTLTTASESDPNWDQLAPLLNDGLAALAASDRDLVTSRFFEKQSHEVIAARLRVPEPAVRKRLSRAVERLRRFFQQRGVRVTGTALAGLLATHGIHAAPSGLAGIVTKAVLTNGAAASASVGALVKSGGSAMAWAQFKVAGLVGALTAAMLAGALVGFGGRFGGQNESGWRLEEIEFTNRFADRVWGNSVATPDGSPHLFVRTTRRRGGGPLGSLIGFVQPSDTNASPVLLQVEDERGNSVEGSFLLRHSSNSRAESDLRELAFFPRRGSNLVLRLLDRRFQVIAQFQVPNPAFAAYPDLEPESLPATRDDGALSVTLEEFVTGWSGGAADAASTPPRFPRRRSTLTVNLREQERPAPAWAVRSLTLADGTGNRWTTSLPATRLVAGAEARLHVEPYLAVWPGEGAWAVDLEFVRTNHFVPEDVVTIHAVPVPPTNQTVELRRELLLGGETLRLLSLAGGQPGTASDETRPPGHLVLRLEGRGMGAVWRPGLIEVRDDGDQAWRVLGSQRNGSQIAFYLEGRSGARTLSLRLARQEIRRVNFTARARANQPPVRTAQ